MHDDALGIRFCFRVKSVSTGTGKTFINNLKIAVVRKPSDVYDGLPATTNCKRSNP